MAVNVFKYPEKIEISLENLGSDHLNWKTYRTTDKLQDSFAQVMKIVNDNPDKQVLFKTPSEFWMPLNSSMSKNYMMSEIEEYDDALKLKGRREVERYKLSHPEEVAKIEQFDRKAQLLINQEFFKKEQEVIDFFRKIPKNSDQNAVYRKLVYGVIKSQTIESINPIIYQQVMDILRDFGLRRQLFASTVYRELHKEKNNDFAQNLFNNLCISSYNGTDPHRIFQNNAIFMKAKGLCWLATQYDVPFNEHKFVSTPKEIAIFVEYRGLQHKFVVAKSKVDIASFASAYWLSKIESQMGNVSPEPERE